MADIENEERQDSQTIDRADLGNLPQKEREETEQILGEISKEGKSDAAPGGGKEGKEGDEIPPKPKEGEAEKPADGKPTTEVKPDEPEKPAPRREASTVPAWMLKVAEDQKGRVEKELAEQKAQAEKALKEGGTPEEVAKQTEEALAKISEKTGIDVDALKELGKLFAGPDPSADPKVKEALEEIERNRQETAAARELAQFNADFNTDILPLIKAEYGDKEGNVPPETVTKIKDALAAVAYTSEYAKVPYTEIYNGKKEFRGIIPPATQGAERSRGGTTRLAEDKAAEKAEAVDWGKLESDPTYAIDDEGLKKLSDTDLDKYFSIVEKRK